MQATLSNFLRRWADLSFSSKTARLSLFDLLLLFAVSLLLNFTGLGALEFFRHTEADRTLIAWEMLENSNYAVPYLLGSEILTKPPLFYWLIAGSMALFGNASEWVARFPSAAAATILVLAQYVFVAKAGGSRGAALLAALFLATSPLFMVLANAAEIDMVFTALAAISLYFVYFSVVATEGSNIFAAYIVNALAFLTKGPPAVFFFAAALAGFSLWQRFTRGSFAAMPLLRFVMLNLLGAAVFLLLSGSWLWLSAEHVGWAELARQFRIEILERVVEPSTHRHGGLFYIGNLMSSLAPWSVLLVLGLAANFLRPAKLESDSFRRFAVFNLIVVVSSVAALSLAEGKSARYLFPVYPFAANLCLAGLSLMRGSIVNRWLFRAGFWIAVLALIAGAAAPLLPLPPEIPRFPLAITSLLLITVLALFTYSSRREFVAGFLLSAVLLMAVVRFAEKSVYAPYRNSTRSVIPIAARVNRQVPKGIPLYTIEMFERWVVYYIKREGREVMRLSPAVAGAPLHSDKRVFILLSFEEESWRVFQLRYHDPSMRIVDDIKQEKEHLLLLEADAGLLRYLVPLEKIPTIPSEPFYWEAAALR